MSSMCLSGILSYKYTNKIEIWSHIKGANLTMKINIISKASAVEKSFDFKNPDLMFDKNVEKVFTEYESTCKNCLPLKFEKRNLELRQEIFQFLQVIKFDFEYIADLCTKANELKSIYENPIDLKALIKNHERIFNGFYINAKNNDSKGSKTGNKTLTPDEVLESAGW